MSKGYITLAQNSGDIDYIRQAYALALSIKNTQTEVNQFAICVESKSLVPQEYHEVFDYIIEIPGTDDAADEDWKIHNKWKYYEMSPFDETVILDADMIFVDDVSYWWEFMSLQDVYWVTSPVTFKGHTITSNYYRKAIEDNNLPNMYTAFFYFKKSPEVKLYFEKVKHIYRNWKLYFYEFMPLSRPKQVSGDIVFALAAKIMGYEAVSNTLGIPCFTHMKSYVQNLPHTEITENWTKHIPTYITDTCEITIGNYRQMLPVHYHIKDWLTDEIIEKLEGVYNVR